MKNQLKIIRNITIGCLLGASLLMTGCAKESTLSKSEQQIQTEAKAAEKQNMVEKKILSDFQNKAYKLYGLEQMTSLPEILNRDIPKLSQENAVKMLLNFELSQRMALQNDPNYGAVSKELAASIGEKQANGLVDPNQLNLTEPALKEEVASLQKSLFAIYKDSSGIYRIVDYRKLQQYKPYITDECSRYVDFMAAESSMPSIRNRRITVDKEEAWRRLILLDDYFTDYPVPSDDLIRNNLGRYYQDLMKHLIYGDDLKPSFDPMTGQMTPEALLFITSHQFGSNSKLNIPFENFKTQLTLDKGLLTPAVGTQIQQLLRIVKEILTDHID